MKPASVLRPSILAIASLALLASAHAGDLVVNGGFESGDFAPGWAQFGDPSSAGVAGNDPFAGTYEAYFGNAVGGGVVQNLATTPGAVYTIGFYLANTDRTRNNAAYVTFGTSVLLNEINIPMGGYQSFTVTATATASSTPLAFTFVNALGYYELDEVSVTEAVPEPSGLAALGLGAVVMFRRKRGRDARKPSESGRLPKGDAAPPYA